MGDWLPLINYLGMSAITVSAVLIGYFVGKHEQRKQQNTQSNKPNPTSD